MNVHLQDENTKILCQTLHNNTDKGNLVSPLLQHQNHLSPTDLKTQIIKFKFLSDPDKFSQQINQGHENQHEYKPK